MSDEIELNDHVLVDDKHPGTVRYKGLVDGHEGLWIGIEWWNQQGKHDGTFQGKVYFQSSKAFSSSFIRPSRISLGRSFSQGISRQYFQTIDRPSSIVDFSLFGKHLSDYEFDLSRLIRLDLSTQWIRNFDEENSTNLYENLSQLKELNLRQNLFKFSSNLWKIIEKYFLHLEIFDLSSSRIIFDENPSKQFVEMKELVFIDLNFDLNQFENIFRSFPNLENLHLDKNRLTTISMEFVEQIRNLRRLSLSDNPQLKHWNPSINSLGQLEHLEELVLNNCGIKTIEIVSQSNRKEFPRLKSLFLSENLIDDFQSIEELAKIDRLESLSLLRNPLYGSSGEAEGETTKQLIIARLPNLIFFNRVFIQRDERRGAEIDYLTFYSKDYFLNCQDFHSKHRQYKRLVDKYGEPSRPSLDQVRSFVCLVFSSQSICLLFDLERKERSRYSIESLSNSIRI